jgi:hypothetical protein
MMIKKVRSSTEVEEVPKYLARGSRKRGAGLSIYQKTVMKDQRESLGISQRELGKLVADMAGLKEPVSQATISYLEKVDPRGRTPSLSSEYLPLIEKVLKLPKGSLEPARKSPAYSQSEPLPPQPPAQTPTQSDAGSVSARPTAQIVDLGEARANLPITMDVGAQDLPVFSSSYGHGAINVGMEAAEYIQRPGKLVRVNNSYGIRVVAGSGMEPVYRAGEVLWINPHMPPLPERHVLFRKQERGGEILIRLLISETDDEWNVRQYNPERTSSLPKAEWPICHRIVGKNEVE